MHGIRTIPSRQLKPGGWLYIAACCFGLSVAALCHGQVVEIRYGVIDPPVIAQQDITMNLLTSIHPQDPEPKPLECSSVVWAGDRMVMVSDRHSHVILTLTADLSGDQIRIGTPEEQVVVDNEKLLLMDAEAMAVRPAGGGGHEVLVVCSLSNDSDGTHRIKREHLARIYLDETGQVDKRRVSVISGDTIRTSLDEHFDALRVSAYSSYNVSRNENTPRWGNLEGVCWTPDRHTLLCGLRNPQADEDALLFVLEGVDKAFDTSDPAMLRVTDLFRLDLGGRGVTDITWDPVTHGYLITSALSNGPKLGDEQAYPLVNLDAALYWWSGNKQDRPYLVAQIRDLNVDSVCRVGSTDFIALVSDEGDVSEERRGRQSVLTLMYFRGVTSEAKP